MGTVAKKAAQPRSEPSASLPSFSNPFDGFLDAITSPRLGISNDVKNALDMPDANKKSQTSADIISLPLVALLGMLTGSGVTFAMFHFRRGTLNAAQVLSHV